MAPPPQTHHASFTSTLLDNRGYSGPLVRGSNPALLLERGVVDRITESYYYKERCFGLNEASLCDRAVELTSIGGTYGDNGRPTPFLCLLFVALSLVPERAVVLEWLSWGGEDEEEHEDEEEGEKQGNNGDGENERQGQRGQRRRLTKKTSHFKYLTALACFYIRLAWSPVEIYTALSPLLADGRKLRQRTRTGFKLTHLDEFVDALLTKDRVCATSLWKLPGRLQLEDLDLLEPYESPLAGEVDDEDEDDDRDDVAAGSESERGSRGSLGSDESDGEVHED